MHSYHIWTIGCQMNKADSERLSSALEGLGFEETAAPRDADVIVLNSCVVRQSAEDKAVGMLTSLKPWRQAKSGRTLAVMGCMVGPQSIALQKRYPYVDVFMRPQQYQPLIDLLGGRMGIDTEGCIGPLTARPAVTAYIPIIHGCDKFCSFCIIPYRRGREVSRPVGDIVRETGLLAERGVKEVTLLGQNVDSFRPDRRFVGTGLHRLHYGFAMNRHQPGPQPLRSSSHQLNIFLGNVGDLHSGHGEDIPPLRCLGAVFNQGLDHELQIAYSHMIGHADGPIPLHQRTPNKLYRRQNAIAQEGMCVKVVHRRSRGQSYHSRRPRVVRHRRGRWGGGDVVKL